MRKKEAFIISFIIKPIRNLIERFEINSGYRTDVSSRCRVINQCHLPGIL